MAKPPRKTALVFTYYWPPASGPGVQRWLKFVKFLPQNGYNAIVVTPKNGSYSSTDPSLIEDVPENTQIETTATLEPFRIFNLLSGKAKRGKSTSVGMGDIKGSKTLIKTIGAYIRANWFIPDARKGWVPFAVKKGSTLINQQKIDVIITTGPPHSSHLIGKKLKDKFNIPWIADFRDPWTTVYYNDLLPRSKRTKKKDLQLENEVLSTAEAILVVSEGLKEEFEERANRIEVIPNGYDDEDFSSLNDLQKSDYFRLSYVGNLKVHQNCMTLWKVIKELGLENPSFKKSFRLSFTGSVHDEIVQTFQDLGIMDMVEILPFVEHREAINRMYKADSLLFIIPDSSNNEKIVTGKIFEYLASKTPLLSIGPVNGDAAKILENCNREKMVGYSEKEKIKSRIQDLFERWKSSDLRIKVEGEGHKQYSRNNLTNKLTRLLSELDQNG